MKMWIIRLRKWLIVKLGGYIEPPFPVVRFDQVDVPIHKICCTVTYLPGCSHETIRREVAKGLAEEICKAGLVKYEYTSDPMIGPDHRTVRGTIRVVERQEE